MHLACNSGEEDDDNNNDADDQGDGDGDGGDGQQLPRATNLQTTSRPGVVML